jgi:imidazolonepropionase-like amidohydrolase
MTSFVIAGAEVFDGRGGPVRQQDVLVEDGKIAAIGTGLPGGSSIDGRGHTLIPGLIDCHIHALVHNIDVWRLVQQPISYRLFEAGRDLVTTLASGITSARDCGGADLGVRQAIEDGVLAGPRLKISVAMLSRTGGHGDYWMPSGVSAGIIPILPQMPANVVDGPDEIRRAVRALLRAGADVVKVAVTGGTLSPRSNPHAAQFSNEELALLVGEARLGGVPVAAHAHGAAGIKAAVRAGVASIEHGVYMDDAAIELMLEHGTFLVPTLAASVSVLEAGRAGQALHEASLRKQEACLQSHRESFRKAYQRGVKIAMGTDAGVTPHGKNLRELSLMVAEGMSPEDALLSATSNAAELLGVGQELGTIEVGKKADLVLLRGRGLDVSDLQERVVAVYQGGRSICTGPGGEMIGP